MDEEVGIEDGLRAVKKAERAASRAHDAMWAMDFDKTSAGRAEREEWKRLREQASNEIWKLHEQLRPLLARLDQFGKEQTDG